MTDTFYTGDYAYSSWSLRGWLLYEAFGIPRKMHRIPFSERDVAEQMAELAPPARTVPSVKCADGAIIWDSLALAEELASRHPDAGHWPKDPTLRATARSMAAEMHSGFSTLRSFCPMGLRSAYVNVPVDAALRADLDRLEAIWDYARAQSGGPWLCGDYSATDAFFAPVAGRIAGFDLPVSDSAQAYVDRHLAHGPFRRWRAMGFAWDDHLPWYDQPYATRDWPGPAPLKASAVEKGPSINDACPYSGLEVTDFMEMDGKIYGFCNAFCRDKTLADPEAWPAFIKIVPS